MAIETIDQLLKRLCDEHDLRCLQVKFRRGDDGRREDDVFDATAIWEGRSSTAYPNCTEWGGTVQVALANVLAAAKARRTPASAVPETIAAPVMEQAA